MSGSEKRRLTEVIVVRCTKQELATIDAAAKSLGITRSAFVRFAALRRAQQVMEGAP